VQFDPPARLRQPHLHQFRVMVSGIIQEDVDQAHGGMKRRVMIELAGAEGTVQLHEISVGESTTARPFKTWGENRAGMP